MAVNVIFCKLFFLLPLTRKYFAHLSRPLQSKILTAETKVIIPEKLLKVRTFDPILTEKLKQSFQMFKVYCVYYNLE